MILNTPHFDLIGKQLIESVKKKEQTEIVIFTGQSGAGKSENTKYLLDYLCFCSKDEWKLRLKSMNPVLELFGNAKTVHNRNSSRFIKFIKVGGSTNDIIIFLHFTFSYSFYCEYVQSCTALSPT